MSYAPTPTPDPTPPTPDPPTPTPDPTPTPELKQLCAWCCDSALCSACSFFCWQPRYKQPNPSQYLVPISLLILFAIMSTQLAQHRQLVPSPETEMYSYPVWFTPSSSDAFSERVYCYADHISTCAAFKDAPTPKNSCCDFLKNGDKPQSRVSGTELMLMVILVPVAIILITIGLSVCSGRFGYNWGKACAEFNTLAFSMLMVAGTTLTIMELFKTQIGCPRPNFFALGALYGYDNDVYEKYDTDRYKNVPSGHSTMAIGFSLFCSSYLYAKLDAYMPASETDPAHDTIRTFGQVACYLPLVFGIWICATRLQDYWHSNAAVALGMLLGGVCAVFSWNSCAAYYCATLWSATDNAKNEQLPIHSKQVEGALKGQ